MPFQCGAPAALWLRAKNAQRKLPGFVFSLFLLELRDFELSDGLTLVLRLWALG
jgi:hypothetical protein